MRIARNGVLFALFAAVLAAQDARPQFTTEQVVDRMVRAEEIRIASLGAYTVMRRYRFENKRVNKSAEILLRLTRTPNGSKSAQVVSESGSAFIRSRVLHKILEAEIEPGQESERDHGRILPANYQFRLIGSSVSEGRPAYLLALIPRSNSRFLIRGRIWVDAEDYAVTRIEASPVKNPSIWIKSVQIVQRFAKVGPCWLPVANASHAEARVFGPTDITIDYFDYVLDQNLVRPPS
jgi:hypothetical protein